MSISFERIKQILKKKAYQEFEEFMKGQTTAMNDVYDDDFLKFVKEQEVTD